MSSLGQTLNGSWVKPQNVHSRCHSGHLHFHSDLRRWRHFPIFPQPLRCCIISSPMAGFRCGRRVPPPGFVNRCRRASPQECELLSHQLRHIDTWLCDDFPRRHPNIADGMGFDVGDVVDLLLLQGRSAVRWRPASERPAGSAVLGFGFGFGGLVHWCAWESGGGSWDWASCMLCSWGFQEPIGRWRSRTTGERSHSLINPFLPVNFLLTCEGWDSWIAALMGCENWFLWTWGGGVEWFNCVSESPNGGGRPLLLWGIQVWGYIGDFQWMNVSCFDACDEGLWGFCHCCFYVVKGFVDLCFPLFLFQTEFFALNFPWSIGLVE